MSLVVGDVANVFVVALNLSEAGVKNRDIGWLEFIVIQMTEQFSEAIILCLDKKFLPMAIFNLIFLGSGRRSFFTARIWVFLFYFWSLWSYQLSRWREFVELQIFVPGRISQSTLDIGNLLQVMVAVGHKLNPLRRCLLFLRLLFIDISNETASFSFLPLFF